MRSLGDTDATDTTLRASNVADVQLQEVSGDPTAPALCTDHIYMTWTQRDPRTVQKDYNKSLKSIYMTKGQRWVSFKVCALICG